MTDSDDELPNIPLTGTQLFGVGAAVGGYYLLRGMTRGSKEDEKEELKAIHQQIRNDVEDEMAREPEISQQETLSHIEQYRNLSHLLNNALPKSQRLNLSEVEDRIENENIKTQALMWKHTAMSLTNARIVDVAGQSAFEQFFGDLQPKWWWFASFGGVAAVIVALRNRFGGGGGGLPNDFVTWVREGIVGDSDAAEEVAEQPDTEEWTETKTVSNPQTGETEQQVEGSPRAAAQDVGLSTKILVTILTYLHLSATDPIKLGETALEAVAGVTDASVNWLVNNPSKAIILAIGLIAAAVLIAGDGPLPVGDAIAFSTVLPAVATATGVSIMASKEGVKQAGGTIQNNSEGIA